VREKSEALRSFDPGFAANFVLKKGPFKVSIALIRHKKKSDFWVFYETSKENPALGKIGAITWLTLLGTGLHP